jgi:hypothetical protein
MNVVISTSLLWLVWYMPILPPERSIGTIVHSLATWTVTTAKLPQPLKFANG